MSKYRYKLYHVVGKHAVWYGSFKYYWLAANYMLKGHNLYDDQNRSYYGNEEGSSKGSAETAPPS